ncbi:MAG: hypothetical protein U0527_04140 [Candidatus Eisenbacteria bacterium]
MPRSRPDANLRAEEDPSLATRGETSWTRPSLALLVLAFALVIAGSAALWFATVDDAFIYYRCAQHLAAGDGPTFNPGERIETFSSMLWTALLAGGIRLGWDPEMLSKLLGLLSALGLIALVARAAVRSAVRPAIAGTTVVALACVPTLHYSSVFGLETAFFALAVALASLVPALGLGFRAETALLAIGLFATITGRPEGVLVAGLVSFVALREQRAQRWGHAIGWSLGLSIIAARLVYFHTLLPAPFLAKPTPWRGALLNGVEGLAFTVARQGYLLLDGLFAIGGGVVALLALRGVLTRSTDLPSAQPAAIRSARAAVLAMLLVLLYASKDWMLGARFALPCAAPLFYLAALQAEELAGAWWSTSQRRLALAAACFVLACLFGLGTTFGVLRDLRRGYRNPALVGSRYVEMGRWLHDHAHPDDRVLAYEIGGIGYASDLTVIDHRGLATEAVARIIERAGRYSDVRLGRDERAMRELAATCVALRPAWCFVRVNAEVFARSEVGSPLLPADAIAPIQQTLVELLGSEFRIAQRFPLRDDGTGEGYLLLHRTPSTLDQPR